MTACVAVGQWGTTGPCNLGLKRAERHSKIDPRCGRSLHTSILHDLDYAVKISYAFIILAKCANVTLDLIDYAYPFTSSAKNPSPFTIPESTCADAGCVNATSAVLSAKMINENKAG